MGIPDLGLDTTLLDFKNRDWVRGQLSIIVDANKPFESRICLIDYEHRSYQILDGTMTRENSSEWLNETVQSSLHMPLIRMHMDFTRLSCKRETSKLLWRKDSTAERVGPYNTQNYSVNHVKILVKKRSEHLTKEDVRFLTALNSHIKQGTVNNAVKVCHIPPFLPSSPSSSFFSFSSSSSSSSSSSLFPSP
ncbi:unnamed protein product, partial [Taenia asiatica]|uniref:Ankyrin repeat domain-containing protein n=1 Tax=Taenia asiatica TaxID=60517 RepID=A0A0R3WBL2_TAEAS